jgi:hypothetical protein
MERGWLRQHRCGAVGRSGRLQRAIFGDGFRRQSVGREQLGHDGDRARGVEAVHARGALAPAAIAFARDRGRRLSMAGLRERSRQSEAPLEKRAGNGGVHVVEVARQRERSGKVALLQRGQNTSCVGDAQRYGVSLADRPPELLAMLQTVRTGEDVGRPFAKHDDYRVLESAPAMLDQTASRAMDPGAAAVTNGPAPRPR